MTFHGVFEQFLDLLFELTGVLVAVRPRIEVPVFVNRHTTPAGGQVMAGRQATHSFDRGGGRRNGAEQQESDGAFRVPLIGGHAAAHQGLNLRGKCQRIPGRRLEVIERLDAQPVPGQNAAGLARVVQGEREHAPKPLQQPFDAPLFVTVEQNFRVRVRPEAMPPGDQLRPQLAIVVDLAVIDRPNRAVFVAHRLVAGG